MFRTEILKLKRSPTWLIVIILPLLTVTAGTINFANNPESLGATWDAFTSQVTIFYAMLFFSMAISLLAANAWRMEHRGSNWNLLLTTTRRPLKLVLAKIVVITIPVAFMQVVLAASTLISGTLVLDLEGEASWRIALVAAFALVAALPLIALQSLLSMLTRSFAAPVALCLAGCILGIAVTSSQTLRPLSLVVPQAINLRALSLGSAAVQDSGDFTATEILPLLTAALFLSAAIATLTLAALRNVRLR